MLVRIVSLIISFVVKHVRGFIEGVRVSFYESGGIMRGGTVPFRYNTLSLEYSAHTYLTWYH